VCNLLTLFGDEEQYINSLPGSQMAAVARPTSLDGPCSKY